MEYKSIKIGCRYNLDRGVGVVGIVVTEKNKMPSNDTAKFIIRYNYVDCTILGCSKGLTFSSDGIFNNIKE